MTTAAQTTQDELVRRHRSASTFIAGLLILNLVLLGISYVAAERIQISEHSSIVLALWTAILVLGLGAFVLRRLRFSATRLKDVAAVQGTAGLLNTLHQTTTLVASMGGAVALIGFAVSILTADWTNMLRAAGVSAIVLAYSYPFRGAWQRAVASLSQE